jgi:hypothetical protein
MRWHHSPPIPRQETARFQASPEKQMRSALFWIITQRVVVISYRFRDNLSVPSSGFKNPKAFGFFNPEEGRDRLSRNVGKKLPLLAV